MLTVTVRSGGSTLAQMGSTCPPDSLVDPRIQKLADPSDVISEVPKYSKIKIFRGSVPYPAEGAYSALPDP